MPQTSPEAICDIPDDWVGSQVDTYDELDFPGNGELVEAFNASDECMANLEMAYVEEELEAQGHDAPSDDRQVDLLKGEYEKAIALVSTRLDAKQNEIDLDYASVKSFITTALFKGGNLDDAFKKLVEDNPPSDT